MKAIRTTLLLLAVSMLFGSMQEIQAQGEDVSSTLETYRVSINTNGEESLEQVNEIQPGDTLEYRLTYTNNLPNAISNLQPVLPIPRGMQYFGTTRPAVNAASLDTTGNTFQSLPIQRQVPLQNGQTVEREAPASEYRRLQWTVASLASGEDTMLTARVRVIDVNTQ